MVKMGNDLIRRGKGFRLIIIGLVLLSLLIVTIPSMAKERLRVSVLDFSGNIPDDLKIVAVNKLTKVLVDLGRFEIVERAEIDKILEEQHLQSTGLIDQSMAVEIGKVLAVDVAFIGNVEYLTSIFNSGYQNFTSEARITVKIIDVQSGKIIHMIETSGYESDQVRKNAELKALEACFSMFFIGEIRHTFAISTSVVRVRDKNIYFLNGEDIGVKKGSRFTVFRTDNKDLDDLGLGESDTFKRKIGVIEVVDIADNLAKAKVVWSSEKIQKGDTLKEIAMVIRPTFNLGFSTTNLEISDQFGQWYPGKIFMLELRAGLERPLVKTTNLVGGIVHIGDVDSNSQTDGSIDILNLGLELVRELPIFKGRLNIVTSGGLGISIGLQQFYESLWSNGDSTDISWYANGFLGLKYYFKRDRGISFEIGMNGQYGPHFARWQEKLDEEFGGDVTDYVKYPEVNCSGLGMRFGINFPINLDQIF